MFLIILFLLCAGRFLSNPDEARYVEIPREMIVSGDFLTPRLNGVKYFEKPPLFYWIEALFVKIFGIWEWGLRIPHLLLGLSGIALLHWFLNRIHEEKLAKKATLILSTSLLYQTLSVFITLDMPMAFFISATMVFFYLHVVEQKVPWIILSGICAGLALLTKGLIALVIPGMIIILYLTWDKQWDKIKFSHLCFAFISFFTVAAPWHIMVCKKNPEFFHKYFIVEHFIRYTTDYHCRVQPFWFFIPVIVLGLFPWSINLLKSVITPPHIPLISQNKRSLFRFALLWGCLPFIFFSFSRSKLIPYILPCMMPFSIIISFFVSFKEKAKVLQVLLLALSALGSSILFIPLESISDYALRYDVFFPIVKTITCGSALLFIVSFFASFKSIYVLTSCSFMIIGGFFAQRLQKPSVKPLIEGVLQQRVKEKVVIWHEYPQDTPVYLEDIVHVVKWKGELEFGTQVENTPWMMEDADFETLIKTENFFILCDNKSVRDLPNTLNLRLLKKNVRYSVFYHNHHSFNK